ncbi:MAG: FGGY family carbohydrate kinase [Christensenellales bacterium]
MKTAMVLPCVSNYIIMKLTGNACCSYSVGKGTGMMNMENTDYADEILQAAGISREILPTLCERTNIVGEISEEFAGECGLAAGTSWSPAQTIPAALPSAPVFPKRAIAI